MSLSEIATNLIGERVEITITRFDLDRSQHTTTILGVVRAVTTGEWSTLALWLETDSGILARSRVGYDSESRTYSELRVLREPKAAQ